MLKSRKPSVTIGLPFVNNRSTIEMAVRSVFAQTFQDWELILLDDGACDGTLELVQEIRDPRVRIVHDGQNRGLAARLNECVRLASADLIARMDADDIMYPTRIERQIAYMRSHPLVDLVDGPIISITPAGQVQGVRGLAPLDAHPASFLRKGVLIHPTVMMRRRWTLRHPYDETMDRCEDLELWSRASETSAFSRLPEPVLFYREGAGKKWQAVLTGHRTWRRIIRERGGRHLGAWGTTRLLASVFARDVVYSVAYATGQVQRLVSRRNERLPPDATRGAIEALRVVAAQPVPGWNRAVATPA
jgi:glycosyltransferase involved in cell wall biosynthesis